MVMNLLAPLSFVPCRDQAIFNMLSNFQDVSFLPRLKKMERRRKTIPPERWEMLYPYQ
jgi:hypothetical protein